MRIYTYYENINFKSQDELIQIWKKSWEDQGFDARILSIEDSKKSLFYEEFLDEIKKIHLEIAGKEIGKYGLSCYFRWLAYSTVDTDESFLVSDYDVINRSFKDDDLLEPHDKISFLDRYCPCLAFGNKNSYLSFANDIIKYSKKLTEDIKGRYLKHHCVHYHDQEFLQLNSNLLTYLGYNLCPVQKYIRLYTHKNPLIEKFKIFHVAHKSAQMAKNDFPELQNIENHRLRLLLSANLLKKLD